MKLILFILTILVFFCESLNITTTEGLVNSTCFFENCTCSSNNVDCDTKKLEEFPHQLNTTTGHINLLDLSHNYIKEIPSHCVSAFHVNLTNFSFNSIETIDEHAFDTQFETNKLDLSWNKLKSHRALNALKPLAPHLFELDLSHNNLGNNMTTKEFAEIFLHLSRLGKLTITHNNITDLFDLSKHEKIYYYCLNNNKIKKLKPYFPSSVQSLRIENNLIEVIPDGVFVNFRNLTFLHLQNNRIRTIGVNAFKYLPNLQDLYLDKNRLEVIENKGLFRHLKMLRGLSLNNQSSLKFIDSFAFNIDEGPGIDLFLSHNFNFEFKIDSFCGTLNNIRISLRNDNNKTKMCFLTELSKTVNITFNAKSTVKKLECKNKIFKSEEFCDNFKKEKETSVQKVISSRMLSSTESMGFTTENGTSVQKPILSSIETMDFKNDNETSVQKSILSSIETMVFTTENKTSVQKVTTSRMLSSTETMGFKNDNEISVPNAILNYNETMVFTTENGTSFQKAILSSTETLGFKNDNEKGVSKEMLSSTESMSLKKENETSVSNSILSSTGTLVFTTENETITSRMLSSTETQETGILKTDKLSSVSSIKSNYYFLGFFILFHKLLFFRHFKSDFNGNFFEFISLKKMKFM
jgi:Leucine-rich repeat (LRR) protein